MKRIKEAAIRQNYVVYTGHRHRQCFDAMLAAGLERLDLFDNAEQGFVTEGGEFVNRTEAAKIAIESGQIKETKWGSELYSEDLY